MNKVADYLQEHVLGEVLASADVRDYFATDGGVFKITPSLIVYPKNTQDVRKTMRFTWQLAEKGHILPVTARGRGSDQSGAAIGKGIIMVFPAHMDHLLELDTRQRLARVQPGMNYRAMQEALLTHGLFLPPYPSSIDYATIGGAIANNAAGEKSVKYGDTRQFVDSLEVVLANGEVLQTGRISKRELDARKGLTTFEGDVYRQVDGIITDNWDLIQKQTALQVSKNTAGYALAQVKRADGSFDLTPLIVGSQGTLGIVTEAIMRLAPYNPRTTLFKISLQELGDISEVTQQLLKLQPSALEIVDQNLLEFIGRVSPNRLKGLVDKPYPAIVLLAEFDDPSDHAQHKKAKQTEKLLRQLGVEFTYTQDYDEQQRLWAIRHSAAAVIWHTEGTKKALPIIEDGIVPRAQLPELLRQVYALFESYKLPVAVWGHAGDANIHLQPFLDLGKLVDRQKVFKIMQDYYSIVLQLGGSTTGEHGDGRIRAPFLPQVFGAEMYGVFEQIKKAFDPYGTLNPGVKTGVDVKDLANMLRHEYSLAHLADHLPRS